MKRYSFSCKPKAAARSAGFTLVELLVVMVVILIMVGAGVTSFKSGNGAEASRGASALASALFGQARNEAIMRQTPCRVIIDTAWKADRPDLAEHYLRRLTLAYLDPAGVDASGNSVTASSGASVDPSKAINWKQADKWTVLPSNVYVDANYSTLHGGSMEITFNSVNAPTGGYSYYEFSPNGQAQYGSLVKFAPGGSTPVTTTPAQMILSMGLVDATGNFRERSANGPTLSCYGFVLFRMGNVAFFRDINDIRQPAS